MASTYKRGLVEQEHPGRPVRATTDVRELKAPPAEGTHHHFLLWQPRVTWVITVSWHSSSVHGIYRAIASPEPGGRAE